MDPLASDIGKISGFLAKKQKGFDAAMDTAREVIRDSAQAITLLHNGELRKAKARLADAHGGVAALMELDKSLEYYAKQAYQEFAEASIFYSIKASGKIPARKDTGVGEEAYLMGLMDVVGELKREILEELRKGAVDAADRHFESMRRIYDGTRSLRFAEAVISGFRKKQDVARIQLESAGSEILSFRHRHQ